MGTALTTTSKIYNAVPMGGYKILVIDPMVSGGGHTCANDDTIDLTGYFDTIVGALSFKSGTITACAWSGLTLTTGQTNLTSIIVFGVI
jgi:hypothetical protein